MRLIWSPGLGGLYFNATRCTVASIRSGGMPLSSHSATSCCAGPFAGIGFNRCWLTNGFAVNPSFAATTIERITSARAVVVASVFKDVFAVCFSAPVTPLDS
jgi:hypothetical protein